MTYGVHALLAALETAEVEHGLSLGTTVEETAAHIAGSRADRVLVLWSFYSPDAEAMAVELSAVRALADRPGVLHIAGGVHATAEPQQVIDAGADLDIPDANGVTALQHAEARGQGAVAELLRAAGAN